jgi:hypothetical protein
MNTPQRKKNLKNGSILNKSLAKETLELPPEPDEDGQSGRKVA